MVKIHKIIRKNVMSHAKRRDFAYDDNFEVKINSVRAFSQLQKWHLIHWIWPMHSSVINHIVVCIFAAYFQLFLENILCCKVPHSLHHKCGLFLTENSHNWYFPWLKLLPLQMGMGFTLAAEDPQPTKSEYPPPRPAPKTTKYL